MMITQYEYSKNDNNFPDSNWADKFTNKDGGELVGPNGGNTDNGSDNSPITGEKTIYLTIVVLLAISAVSAFLFRQRKGDAN